MQQVRTSRSRAASTGLAAGGARVPGAAVPPATAGGPPAAAAAPPAAAGGPPATCRCRCCSCHCCCSTCRWRRCSSCLSAHLVDNRPFVLSSPVVALELKLAACCGILSGFATEDARCFHSAFRGLRMSRPSVHPAVRERLRDGALLARQLGAIATVLHPASEHRFDFRGCAWPLH